MSMDPNYFSPSRHEPITTASGSVNSRWERWSLGRSTLVLDMLSGRLPFVGIALRRPASNC